MKYRLRGDLSKAAVYMVVKQFAPLGITLPSMRKCDFSKWYGSYWLYFDFDGHRFKTSVYGTLNVAYVVYDIECWDMDSASADYFAKFKRQFVQLPLGYLFGNQLVREVA